MACCPDQPLDIETTIANFLSDSTRSSLQLPHLTTGQRKQTKMVVARYPELLCESFGFGNERQLHLFKPAMQDILSEGTLRSRPDLEQATVTADATGSSVVLKNTCIDDWLTAEADDGRSEPIVFRSMPPKLAEITMDHCPSADHSTVASSCSPTPRSPVSMASKSLQDSQLLKDCGAPRGLEIRNTFIHFPTEQVDERAVQSMPHGMFRQSLLADACVAARDRAAPVPDILPAPCAYSSKGIEDPSLAPGSVVVIQGLLKAPAFNGICASVQSFDDVSGRYSVAFATPVAGHATAKVKRENLWPVPMESSSMTDLDLPIWPATPTGEWQACARHTLSLTALI